MSIITGMAIPSGLVCNAAISCIPSLLYMHVYTLLSPLCQLLDTYVQWASLLLYTHACMPA